MFNAVNEKKQQQQHLHRTYGKETGTYFTDSEAFKSGANSPTTGVITQWVRSSRGGEDNAGESGPTTPRVESAESTCSDRLLLLVPEISNSDIIVESFDNEAKRLMTARSCNSGTSRYRLWPSIGT